MWNDFEIDPLAPLWAGLFLPGLIFLGHLLSAGERIEQYKDMGPVSEKVSEKKPRGRQAAAVLGPNAEIGRKLKQYYESLVTEEVPDRFAQLLSKLESVETKLEKD